MTYRNISGERGIRTPGGVTLNGFQDRRNRPLCHLSKPSGFWWCKYKVLLYFEQIILAKFF